MAKLFARFVKNESGATAIEYGLIAALIALAIMVGAGSLGNSLNNQVDDLSVNQIVRDEADCRIGQTQSGSAVDPTSPTCQDAIARVIRFASGGRAGEIESIRVNPINIALEKTTGIDAAFRASFPTGIGSGRDEAPAS